MQWLLSNLNPMLSSKPYPKMAMAKSRAKKSNKILIFLMSQRPNIPVKSLTFLETYGFMMEWPLETFPSMRARLVMLASLIFINAEIKSYAWPFMPKAHLRTNKRTSFCYAKQRPSSSKFGNFMRPCKQLQPLAEQEIEILDGRCKRYRLWWCTEDLL